MLYAALIIIHVFMGVTIAMTDQDEMNVIQEILQLREKMQQIYRDETLDENKKAHMLYYMLPTTKDKYYFLFVGDYEEKLKNSHLLGEWEWRYETEEGKIFRKFLIRAPKIVSPKAIMDKFTDIVRNEPIDVEAIINSTNHDKQAYWDSFYEYMDGKLLPPEPEGEYEELEEDEQQRADEFKRLLEAKDDEFLIRFMLLAGFQDNGSMYINIPINYDDRIYIGKAVSYAEGAIYDSFPAWYRQWNKLVLTICVRRSDGFAQQELCPDPNFIEEEPR